MKNRSHRPQKTTHWKMPVPGNLVNAARPVGTSANFKPVEGDKKPGNLTYSGTMYPMQASMLTRPCLISILRRRKKSFGSPSAQKPAGSQKPIGAWTPSSFSNA